MELLFVAILCICVSLITNIVAVGNVSKLFNLIKKIYIVILPISILEWIYELIEKNKWFGFQNQSFVVLSVNIISIVVSIVVWSIYRKKRRREYKYKLSYGMTHVSNDLNVQYYWIILNLIIVSCIVLNLIFAMNFVVMNFFKA